MKKPFAAAALLAMAAPAAAAADDRDYDNLIDCVAYNNLLIAALSGKGKDTNPAHIGAFKGRASAMTTIATAFSKSPAENVQADIVSRQDAILTTLSINGFVEQLLGKFALRCDTLGRVSSLAVAAAKGK